jgi:myo-inositol 2-dehydrogenase / D-chiro-inositol 1-dehydrogenase
MTVRVGVIGVGNIGEDHVHRLSMRLSGSRVAALSDVDADRAHSVADRVPGARIHATGRDLTRDEGIDAILVASSAPSHEDYVLAAIEEGKPVFCGLSISDRGRGSHTDGRATDRVRSRHARDPADLSTAPSS